MSVRLASRCIVFSATAAIVFILFTPYIQAQDCHTAHAPTALKAMQENADAGDADSQCGLGKQYEYGLGVSQDNKQAALWLQKSAEQGDVRAQVELGVVFDKMQDYVQALIWYRKAADQGNARAQYNLGLCYQNGESVAKDVLQAIAWYRKAADQGDTLAQNNLAVIYDQGAGIPQDYSQAAYWYRKAAEQGLAEAQYGLGYLYLHGNGVPKDEIQATTWMRKAAEQGQTFAQFNLGACYLNGAGVELDLKEGYFWILLAHTRTPDVGLKEHAEETLGKLSRVMKKSEIKSAEKRAQDWLKRHPLKTGAVPSGVAG